MFRFFHICLHQKPDYTVREATKTVTVVNNQTDIDTLIKAASVLEIKEVRVLKYTPRPDLEQLTYDGSGQIMDNPAIEKGFYDSGFHYYQNYGNFYDDGADISNPLPPDFFSTYLKNRVQWHVEPPIIYQVVMNVRYDQDVVSYASLNDCDMCQGRGWYIDILNTNGQFESDDGTIKVVQRVFKDFLTEVSTSSLNLNYGTIIKRAVAQASSDDEVLFEDIRLILSEVEQIYIQRQITEYELLAQDERLISLNVERLARSNHNKLIIQMDLKVTTEAGSRLFRLGI